VKHEIGNSAFCQLQVLDMPGVLGDEQMERVLQSCATLIFVIDVTSEETDEALQRLHFTIVRAHAANPGVCIEVFIHKADALTEEQKVHCQRELQERVDDELQDAGLAQVIDSISYRATSIFDHSVYEAFSQVVQKLTPETAILESLLDFLVNNCGMEKAFLFDVVSKLYVATDATPVHPQDFELCSDMIDVIVDISCIYDLNVQDSANPDLEDTNGDEGADSQLDTPAAAAAGANSSEDRSATAARAMFGRQAHSASTIRLSNSLVLHMREVSSYLSLCCIMRADVFDAAMGLIEYNISVFEESLAHVISQRVEPAAAAATAAAASLNSPS